MLVVSVFQGSGDGAAKDTAKLDALARAQAKKAAGDKVGAVRLHGSACDMLLLWHFLHCDHIGFVSVLMIGSPPATHFPSFSHDKLSFIRFVAYGFGGFT